jgi:hypothetical protein
MSTKIENFEARFFQKISANLKDTIAKSGQLANFARLCKILSIIATIRKLYLAIQANY